jgi:DNA polymerase I
MSRQSTDTARPNQLVMLRQFLAEAHALGAAFRLSGVDVLVDSPAPLPDPIQEALARRRPCGLLWAYLGGAAQGAPALALAKQLGITPLLIMTADQAKFAVRQLILDMREYGGHLGIDVETAPLPGFGTPRPAIRLNQDGGVSAVQSAKDDDRTALDPHRSDIATLQLYAGGNACFVFRGAALRLVASSHWLRRQCLVAHNAAFELSFLRRHPAIPQTYAQTAGQLHCTMQAAGLLTGLSFGGGGGRSLATAAQNFLGIDVPKGLQTSDWGARALSPGQLAYAAMDAVVAWRLWPILHEQLQEKDRIAAYELQRGAIPAVVAMERRGLGFDPAEHARQTAVWADDLAQARQEYQAETGNSPPTTAAELRKWLTSVLSATRLDRWPRTAKTEELSTANKDLLRLGDIPSARPVLKMLSSAKLLSTFGPTLREQVNPVTARIHTHYNLAGTKAGRFSASHPNLQQLPSKRAPEFRRCIVAAPGSVLIGCDWNQVEVRAAAWVSGDPALTELYRSGADLHQENAAIIAGVPLADVTKEQRTAAKAVTFGALYGISATSMAGYAFANYGVEMTVAEAQGALDAFFRRFPRLARWRRENQDRCQTRGYIAIGCGRVVEAAWEPYGLSFPQCCNLPIQGICADAMLRVITVVHRRYIAAGIRGGLVATVHDELLAEVVEPDAEQARDILQHTMVEAFETTFPGAPSNGVAEAEIGRTWADLK